MQKITNDELKNFYGGGFVATVFGWAVISAVVAGVYKMLNAEEAKVKIPGGTEISFSKATKPKNSGNISSTSRSDSASSGEEPTLKMLQNDGNTYFSHNENFLIKY